MRIFRWTLLSLTIVLCLPAMAGAASRLAEISSYQTYVYNRPTQGAKPILHLFRYQAINGQPVRLPLLGQYDRPGQHWVKVALPIRQNQGRGWIPRSRVALSWAQYRIRINTGQRRLRVFYRGRVLRTTRVIIGAPATPTPRGRFFAVDGLRLDVPWAHMGWALVTSAFSERLRHFEGGQGQVAIHTTGTLSGRLGDAASHGCVRVPPGFAKWLVFRIPNGTPIEIV